jgi:hypothetical protein
MMDAHEHLPSRATPLTLSFFVLFATFPLAVVDVHQGWCGPCGVMEPVMRKIKLGNERLLVKFYTVRARQEVVRTPVSDCSPPSPSSHPHHLLHPRS